MVRKAPVGAVLAAVVLLCSAGCGGGKPCESQIETGRVESPKKGYVAVSKQHGLCQGATGAPITDVYLRKKGELRFAEFAIRVVGEPDVQLEWLGETTLKISLSNVPREADEHLRIHNPLVKGVRVVLVAPRTLNVEPGVPEPMWIDDSKPQ